MVHLGVEGRLLEEVLGTDSARAILEHFSEIDVEVRRDYKRKGVYRFTYFVPAKKEGLQPIIQEVELHLLAGKRNVGYNVVLPGENQVNIGRGTLMCRSPPTLLKSDDLRVSFIRPDPSCSGTRLEIIAAKDGNIRAVNKEPYFVCSRVQLLGVLEEVGVKANFDEEFYSGLVADYLALEHEVISLREQVASANVSDVSDGRVAELEVARYRGERDELADQVAVLVEEAKGYVSRVTELEEIVAGNEEDKALLLGQVTELEETNAALQDRIARCESHISKLEETVADYEKVNAALSDRVTELEETESNPRKIITLSKSRIRPSPEHQLTSAPKVRRRAESSSKEECIYNLAQELMAHCSEIERYWCGDLYLGPADDDSENWVPYSPDAPALTVANDRMVLRPYVNIDVNNALGKYYRKRRTKDGLDFGVFPGGNYPAIFVLYVQMTYFEDRNLDSYEDLGKKFGFTRVSLNEANRIGLLKRVNRAFDREFTLPTLRQVYSTFWQNREEFSAGLKND